MSAAIFVLTVAAGSALAYAALQRIDIGFVPTTKAQRNTATLIAAAVGAVLALIVLVAVL